jgi:hypothetical protein
MAKIIVGAALMAASIATLMVAPFLTPAMTAMLVSMATAGFSMVLGGIAQLVIGQHSPGTGVVVKQSAMPWNVVYGRCRLGGVVAYINTYSDQNVALDLVTVQTGHHVARVGNAGRANGYGGTSPYGGVYLDGKEVLFDTWGNANGGQLTDADGNQYSWDTGGGRGVGGSSWVYSLRNVGSPSQTAVYPLQNRSDPNWKASCTLSGRAYTYLNLIWDASRFRNGEPGIRVDIVGKDDIYDPRTDVRGAVTIAAGALSTLTGMTFPTQLNGANIVIAGAGPGIKGNGQPNDQLAVLTVDANGNGTINPAAAQAASNASCYTCGYTENWALCVADYLCNSEFGLGCNYGTEIDEEQLIAAANICDEQVPVRYSNFPGWTADTPFTFGEMIAPGNGFAYMCIQNGVTGGVAPSWPTNIGGTVYDGSTDHIKVLWQCKGLANANLSEPRYTMNGTFQTATTPGDVLSNMLTAAAGRVAYVGGTWKIYPAAWYGFAVDANGQQIVVTDDDVIGTVKWIPNRKYRDLVNAVRGTFISPTFPYIHTGPGLPLNLRQHGVFDGQWQPADFPCYAQDPDHGYAQDANYLADGSVTLWQDLRLPFTISAAASQRIAKIYLMRNRKQGTGTIPTKLSLLRAQALDVVQWTRPSLNFNLKAVEITNFRWRPDYSHTPELEAASNSSREGENKAPVLYCELDLHETGPEDYAWSSTEELPMDSPDILS